MTTANAIITRSLRLLGVVGRGRSPTGDQINDGLEALNDMVASWSSETIVIPSRIEDVYTIADSKRSFTFGKGGDIDTDWAMKLSHAFYRQNSVDYPLHISNERRQDSLPVKNVAGIPDWISYTPSYPLGTIEFDYIPYVGDEVHIISEKPLTAFTLGADISLPSDFDRALKYNLAIELAAEYGKGSTVPASVAKGADESKQAIKLRMAQYRVPRLDIDHGLTSIFQNTFNVYSGY